MDFYEDLTNGDVPTFEEFESRISPEALGEPGGVVGNSYDRLLSAVESGDEATAVAETARLEELCFDVLNN